jgi:hypothetical protein
LPELGWCRRLVAELVIGLDNDKGWTGDQIMDFENPVNLSIRDNEALAVRELDGKLPGQKIGLVYGQVDNLVPAFA